MEGGGGGGGGRGDTKSGTTGIFVERPAQVLKGTSQTHRQWARTG